MRYRNRMKFALVAAGVLAMAAADNTAFATPPGGGSSITLAQAQQPTTPTPTTPTTATPAAAAPTTAAPTTAAPAMGAQPGSSGMSTTMPGKMMEKGKGMGEMGGQGHPGPMMGPMGGRPAEGMPCPSGQTASGTPPTCK